MLGASLPQSWSPTESPCSPSGILLAALSRTLSSYATAALEDPQSPGLSCHPALDLLGLLPGTLPCPLPPLTCPCCVLTAPGLFPPQRLFSEFIPT